MKVFWIQPKRQRGFARDVERLKRRVRLEVAIAQSAPADIPLGVWSHLSHVVMPLDVVEPTSNFTPPPDDRTRYWPQWVVFERFAGAYGVCFRFARFRLLVTHSPTCFPCLSASVWTRHIANCWAGNDALGAVDSRGDFPAGDLAMLRGLPFASAAAKLSATKQMLM